MAKRIHVHIGFDTALSPQRVLAALTDFSEHRPDVWPQLDPARYQVHEAGESSAVVTEGNREPPVWAMERYDWSPARVSIKAIESNFCVPGDGTDIVISSIGGGGSHIELDWEREAASPEWEPLMEAIAEGGETILLASYRDRFEELAAATG